MRYLFRMLSNLTEIKRKKLYCIILFLDFEKAFIPLLIIKLRNFNIAGSILKLIDSFLTRREVTLQVNNCEGPIRKGGLYGLPQGSVLSLFLFILYISDMLE